mgnify:CR=1 FL=1
MNSDIDISISVLIIFEKPNLDTCLTQTNPNQYKKMNMPTPNFVERAKRPSKWQPFNCCGFKSIHPETSIGLAPFSQKKYFDTI